MQNQISTYTQKAKLILAASIIGVSLVGCGSTEWGFPYKATVQQGNWITAEQVAQLEPGMTREQVRFILGTPTLQDIFHAQRWDYPFYNKPGYGDEELRKFTVWFENNLLVRWQGDEQPDRQPFEKTDSGKAAIDGEENLDESSATASEDATQAVTETNVADQAEPSTEEQQ